MMVLWRQKYGVHGVGGMVGICVGWSSVMTPRICNLRLRFDMC